MPTYPHDAEIDVQRLIFDEQNPRIPDGTSGQREAMLRLADYQGPKLLSLAAHVAANGLNPAQRFIVIPRGEDYVVLDGNRRLSALKALETPAAFPNLTSAQLRRLRSLSDGTKLPRTVSSVVFRDAAQAEPWVRLTHLNQRGGVSLSRWSAVQKARHEERLGGPPPPALQVLDFVRAGGRLSPGAQAKIYSDAFPLTMVERMLETKEAKPALGIGIKDGLVTTAYPREQVLTGLTRLIEDVAAGVVNSRTLNRVRDRLNYLGSYDESEQPDPATIGPEAVALASAPPGRQSTSSKRPPARRDRPSTATRPHLIPSGFTIAIPNDRVHEIYLELKNSLRVEDHPNAVGALLRVFLEMSLTLYCRQNKLGSKGNEYFRDHWTKARAELLKTGTLDDKSLNAIQASIIESNTGLTTVQASVHNPDFPVTGIELKRLWDRLQPLFAALWPS